ncbi:MAG: 30S ribosomal protein S6, partial [Clostridia bacterium]|nr:30S ribosomal protein S6 [Clostridia bacterium]
DLPREIERNLEINENIMRYLTIKLEEKKHSVKPRPVRVAPAAPVAEAEVTEAPAEEVAETPAE